MCLSTFENDSFSIILLLKYLSLQHELLLLKCYRSCERYIIYTYTETKYLLFERHFQNRKLTIYNTNIVWTAASFKTRKSYTNRSTRLIFTYITVRTGGWFFLFRFIGFIVVRLSEAILFTLLLQFLNKFCCQVIMNFFKFGSNLVYFVFFFSLIKWLILSSYSLRFCQVVFSCLDFSFFADARASLMTLAIDWSCSASDNNWLMFWCEVSSLNGLTIDGLFCCTFSFVDFAWSFGDNSNFSVFFARSNLNFVSLSHFFSVSQYTHHRQACFRQVQKMRNFEHVAVDIKT